MQAPPTVETRQLLLRAPGPADVDPLFEIQGNSEIMRFTYCAPDRAATERYLENYAARFSVDGFAPWAAEFKADNRVVGWGGLNRDPQAPQWGTEIAYFIHQEYWSRGLASELVGASLDLAFDRLCLAQIGAFTKPENVASSRVLEKAGFSFVRYVPELGRDYFTISKQQRSVNGRTDS